MIDRKTMMWDFLKNIINTPTDEQGMIFIACSDSPDAYKKFSEISEIATDKGSKIINNTIKFGEGESEVTFTRCDKIFIHSGESRNSIYGNDVIGKTSPCFTALMTETITLLNNSFDQKPMHVLLLSLKRSQLGSEKTDDASKGEKYSAHQVWLARCNALEILSIYSTNMLKYGIMAECLWIRHKLSKPIGKSDKNGNFDVEYGICAHEDDKA